MDELIETINKAIKELDRLDTAIRDDENMDWKLKEVKFSADEGCCVFYCEKVK